MQKILLPGGDKQLELLVKSVNLTGKKILVAGANSAPAAEELTSLSGVAAEFIVEDYESLINANLYFTSKEIIPKMMDFSVTDYESDTFDLIYAQGSVSGYERKLTIKEFKRVLKPGGILCAGEIILRSDEVPGFVEELLERSNLNPFNMESISKFYAERNFTPLIQKEMSETLPEFYSAVRQRSHEIAEELTEDEKTYYKKLLKKSSHEANAFLDFGAGKYIGFYVLVLKLN